MRTASGACATRTRSHCKHAALAWQEPFCNDLFRLRPEELENLSLVQASSPAPAYSEGLPLWQAAAGCEAVSGWGGLPRGGQGGCLGTFRRGLRTRSGHRNGPSVSLGSLSERHCLDSICVRMVSPLEEKRDKRKAHFCLLVTKGRCLTTFLASPKAHTITFTEPPSQPANTPGFSCNS